jgi:2-succinyl-5-enolpyruvyl-6-hydroxy-3-cyclohexene-1-carboxylate synthase
VVNNDGGGIFHFLPVREHEPYFTPLFATPHGVEPERVAALYDLPYERAEPSDLADRVRAALAEPQGGTRLIEVRTDREINRLRRDAATLAARAAAVASLDPR